MNSFRPYPTIAGLLLFALQGVTSAQSSAVKLSHLRAYSNSEYGFKVEYPGTFVNRGSGHFLMNLPTTTSITGSMSSAHIFVSQRPFVYLPGSFGGKYYFENGNTGLTSSDRVHGDSVSVNGLKFARDYWLVYAGEGQWETVINCYALTAGHYYTVSLQHDFATPLPGELLDGSRITKRQIRAKLIRALRDTSNAYVASFDEILRSFSVTK